MNKILEQLDLMAKRREAATPGPWGQMYACGDSAHYRSPGIKINLNKTESWSLGPRVRTTSQAIKDAEFIVAARTEHEILEKALRIALEKIDFIRLDAGTDVENWKTKRIYESARDVLKEIEALFEEK